MEADALSGGLQVEASLQDSLAGLAQKSAQLWACDASSGQVYLSVHARDLLGIGAEEPATLSRLVAATHAGDRDLLQHCLLGRDPAHTTFTIDIRPTHNEPGDRKLRLDGRVHRVAGSVRTAGSVVDVTERRREEERLRFGDLQLRAVAEGVATLISYVDRELRYRFANNAYERWFGMRPDEVIGLSVREVLGDAGFTHIEPYLRQALGGLPARFTTAVPHVDGSLRHVTAVYTPDFTEDGDVRGVFVAVTDISDLKRTERELRESRALMQVVIDSSPTSIFMKDVDGRYLLANPQTRRLLGGQDRPIVGATDMDLFPPETAQALRDNDLRVMGNRVSEPCEEQVRTPDGALRTFITVKAPLIDEEDRVFGICGIATDITGRKQTEDALRISNDRFTKAFRCAPCPMTITTLAGDRHVDVNDAYLAMTGFTREEVIGRTDVEIGLLTLEEREEFGAQVRQALSARALPLRYRTKEGRALDLRVSAERIEVDGEGCLLSAVTDETLQRRMLEKLRQSEEAADARAQQLAAVLEATPAAIWIAHDPECTLVTGSRAGRAMLRVASVDNLSRTVDTVGHLGHFKVLCNGRELSPGELPLQRAARGETIRDFEEEIVFDNGDRRHLLGDAVPLRDANGRLCGAVAAFVDVTRLRETAAQLADANRRKDEFLAILGHELRSPLSAIHSASHVLGTIGDAPAQTARLAGILQRQSSQVTRLVDDLLDVSRITHGKIAIRREDVPVRVVIDRAVEASIQLIESSRHVLQVSIEDESMRIQGDLARLSQVISNLLNNAARYTPAGGRIYLDASRRGNWLRVVVSDDGIGLAPDALERIFVLFEQGEEVRTRSSGGLGVGLALARALVHLHGGSLTASSEGPGRGSQFEILLPLP